MAKLVCKILGIFFVVVGTVVLILGANVDKYHFGLHVIHGLIAIGFGFFASMNQAKVFCVISGILYLTIALPGFFVGDPAMHREWHIGPMHLNVADHIFHTVLGLGLLVVGALTKKKVPVRT